MYIRKCMEHLSSKFCIKPLPPPRAGLNMRSTLCLTFMLAGNLAVVYCGQETLYTGLLFTTSTLLGPPPQEMRCAQSYYVLYN